MTMDSVGRFNVEAMFQPLTTEADADADADVSEGKLSPRRSEVTPGCHRRQVPVFSEQMARTELVDSFVGICVGVCVGVGVGVGNGVDNIILLPIEQRHHVQLIGWRGQ